MSQEIIADILYPLSETDGKKKDNQAKKVAVNAIEFADDSLQSYIHNANLKPFSVHIPYETPAVQDDIPGVIFYVIGDKFRHFSDNNIVLTYSDAIKHINILVQVARCVVIEQGLSVAEAELLRAQILSRAGLRRVRVVGGEQARAKSSSLLDKVAEKDILITEPTQTGSVSFQSNLVVDDDCHSMVDHHVSQHIPGMCLIEAARQMFMVCAFNSEIVRSSTKQVNTAKFALNSMQARFEHFVFPLAVTLRLQFSDIKTRGSSLSGAARVDFYQLGRQCGEVRFVAHAYSERVFSSLEVRSANKIRRRLYYADAPALLSE